MLTMKIQKKSIKNVDTVEGEAIEKGTLKGLRKIGLLKK